MVNEKEFMSSISDSLAKSFEDYGVDLSIPTLLVLTGLSELTDEYVTKQSQQLTNQYSYLIKSFGFENFKDMYLFAKKIPDSSYAEKNGQKDFAKLNKVKQTVIRNGKPVEITVYQKNEDSDTNELNKGKKTETDSVGGETVTSSAKDLPTIAIDNKRLSKEVKAFLKRFSGGATAVGASDTQSYSVSSVNEDGTSSIRGVYSFKQLGQYLYLSDVVADDTLYGLGIKAFFSLLYEAYKQNLGAMVPVQSSELALGLFETYGLEQDHNVFKIEPDALQSSLEGVLK